MRHPGYSPRDRLLQFRKGDRFSGSPRNDHHVAPYLRRLEHFPHSGPEPAFHPVPMYCRTHLPADRKPKPAEGESVWLRVDYKRWRIGPAAVVEDVLEVPLPNEGGIALSGA